MSKFFKKAVVLLLTIVCAFGTMGLIGCGEDGPVSNHVKDQKLDPNKAQLYVSNFNGGVGTEWLYDNIALFQEKYKDVKFTPDTTGVQVWVDAHKNNASSVYSKMKYEDVQIYFMGGGNYLDMVYGGNLYDMTHLVNESLYEVGEGAESGDDMVTIESKLPDIYKEYFGVETNGQTKYYALPHYEIFSTITYDIDIFDEKQLFFDTNGELTKKSTDAGRGTGPDGQIGTYDDGLPATYAQFYKLCETMKIRGVTPIIWSGQYDFYTTEYMAGLKADFEGLESAVPVNVSGTMTKLVDSVTGSGANRVINYKQPTVISPANGYEIFNSAGTLHALSFFETIVDNGWDDNASRNEATTHTGAQKTFLTSKYNSKSQPIGMLVEGTYWTHESADTFRQMEGRYKNSSLAERRLGVMPFPKVDDTQLGKNTIKRSSGICCMNGKLEKGSDMANLAELFVKFCHTNDALARFFMTTNVSRGYNYTLTPAQQAQVTPYGNSLRTLIENSQHVSGSSTNDFVYKNYTMLTPLGNFLTSKYGDDPIDALKDGTSAETIFAEIRAKYDSTSWNDLISK